MPPKMTKAGQNDPRALETKSVTAALCSLGSRALSASVCEKLQAHIWVIKPIPG